MGNGGQNGRCMIQSVTMPGETDASSVSQGGPLVNHVVCKKEGLTVGDKITLRSLFFVTALTAVLLLVVRLAVISQGQNVWAGIATMVLIPVVTFSLFGLAFVVLLPFGIIAAMTRESVAPGTSPFADDRLPDKQMDVVDAERAN